MLRRARAGVDRPASDWSALQPAKLRAIDFAVERVQARSVADLGGVWAVEGGYVRYALDRPGVTAGVLVDTGLTDAVRSFAAADPRLRLVSGEFGSEASVAAVGQVDVVLLLDVLLHQVGPDWDEVLRRYSKTARCIVIVEPTWTGDDVVRFWDLGEEGYRANTPSDGAVPQWSQLDDIHPGYGRPHRDVHEYWQWGLPDHARRDLMAGLGWTCAYWADHGPWKDVPTSRTVASVYLAPGAF
ncbi:MAG: hypothetical protein JWO12_2190 [Frankiales bacterium]|nr:hypothetical protein [Frankiales bacterium]